MSSNTAPLGPGHPLYDTSNSGMPPLPILQSQFIPSLRSTILSRGLHPNAISQIIAPTANLLYANHQFTFPPPLQASAPYGNALDYPSRYRPQVELLSRTGVPHDHSTVARYAQSYNLRGDPQDYPVPPSPIGVEYRHNIDNKDYPQSLSRLATTDGTVQDREGFSSAFGLISLDEHEVLAGFGEGPPFFDNSITHGSGSVHHNPT
ncbi:hypothetical protein BGW80DRAFT_1466715 [Lactifluus volemus]|nr:hypothetical protein BGW80DRAFT_1466715 [Lactifluus volemus]